MDKPAIGVYKKLNDARQQFHTKVLKKTGENKFAKYSYFELGDFLIPALEVFRNVGLCAVVSFDESIARMIIVDVDDLSTIVITSPMGSADLKGCHVVQNIGAVETYQRRYLWVAALEIVEHDAIDGGDGGTKKEDRPDPKINAGQLKTLQALVNETGTEISMLLEWASEKLGSKIEKLSELPASAYDSVFAALSKKKKADK